MILGLTERIVVLDSETGSPTQLGPKGRGAANYWADPRTRVFMFGWKKFRSDEPPGVADFEVRGDTLPDWLVRDIQCPPSECMLAAYNCEFDRAALARLGYPTPPEKWMDIMILAYFLSFAGKLNDVLKQVGLGVAKHPRGSRAITVFSKQFKPWWEDPALWQDFRDYCADDARIEEELLRWLVWQLEKPWMLPQVHHLSGQELIYRHIGHRGVPMDRRAIEGAVQIMNVEKDQIIQSMSEVTGLENPNSRNQLLQWLQGQGSEILSLTKDVVRDEIEYQTAHLETEELDPTNTKVVAARRKIISVLKMRQDVSKTSTSKFEAMDRNLCRWDDRIRGAWQFFGATRTGRVAGRIINFANLARPRLENPDLTVECVAEGDHRLLTLLYPKNQVLETLSWCIRASCMAPKGKLFCVADLTSIESVGLAWLSGCDQILDIFFAGRDSYKTFAADYYKIPYDEVTKEQRTFSKAPVLGAGFGASGYALVSYAAGMGITITEEEGASLVAAFRELYHQIPHYWKQLGNAFRDAYRNPGTTYRVYAADGWTETIDPMSMKIERTYTYKAWPYVEYTYMPETQFMYCKLPSGRFLTYFKPSLKDIVIHMRNGHSFTARNAIHYWGNDQKATGTKWSEISVSDALLAENNTQALCRDAMWNGLEQAEADPRFELVLEVYDEIGTLIEENDTGALDQLIAYMTSKAPWMDDRFFLGADGYMRKRYKK